MADRLKDKVAIIVGGATGIGRATAVRFVKEGGLVMIADRNVSEMEKTLQFSRQYGSDVDQVAVDVSKWNQVENMVDVTMRRYGRVDVLVNLAAVLMLTGPLVEVEERQWDMIMDINLKGSFFTMKATIPHMIKTGGGSIINVASSAAIDAFTRSLPYNVSKAGLQHLTNVAAGQYTSQGIRINCVIPGSVDTPQARGSTQSHESIKNSMLRHPMGRIGKPEELANVILFLASDEASYVSGSTYIADGGAQNSGRRNY
jgi:NAD(P)-dependent dehydrogenase (short-subunit alcohol dehydrogenase family)